MSEHSQSFQIWKTMAEKAELVGIKWSGPADQLEVGLSDLPAWVRTAILEHRQAYCASVPGKLEVASGNPVPNPEPGPPPPPYPGPPPEPPIVNCTRSHWSGKCSDGTTYNCTTVVCTDGFSDTVCNHECD